MKEQDKTSEKQLHGGDRQHSRKRIQNNNSTDDFSSVVQSCPTLCDPMDCSTPGIPVHHQLPELAQTHVHRVSDAPAFNLSQHQGLFK